MGERGGKGRGYGGLGEIGRGRQTWHLDCIFESDQWIVETLGGPNRGSAQRASRGECEMSAYLDKSQGVTFVYSNIFEIYQKAKNAKIDAPFVAERPRVLKESAAQQVTDFIPRELELPSGERPFPVPMGVREAEEKAKQQSLRPLAGLQKNLNDLTDAHEKLRFLLQELDLLTKKK